MGGGKSVLILLLTQVKVTTVFSIWDRKIKQQQKITVAQLMNYKVTSHINTDKTCNDQYRTKF
jgi:hypothetical protein